MNAKKPHAAYRSTPAPHGLSGPPVGGAGPNRFLLFACEFWLIANVIRPQDMLPVVRAALVATPPGVIATLLMVFALIPRLKEIRWRDPMLIGYFIFMGAIVAGVAYAPNTYWLFQMFETMLIQGIFGFLAFPILFRNEHCRKIILRTIVLSFVVTAIWAISHNGRGQGAFLGDENDVALYLCLGLPICYFLSRGATSTRSRLWLLAAAAASVVGTVLTFSRGGFLGIAASIPAIGLYLRRPIRFFVVASLLIVAAIPFLAALQPAEGRGKTRSYLDEITSIGDQSDSTRNERIYTWTGGWVMFKANPVLGVGAGNFPFAIVRYENDPEMVARSLGRSFGGRAAHSIYFTLLSELGAVGAVAYVVILFGALRRTWVASRPGSSHALAPLAAGIGAGLVAYSVAGVFLSALYYPQFWLFAGIVSTILPRADPMDSDSSSRDRASPEGAQHRTVRGPAQR